MPDRRRPSRAAFLAVMLLSSLAACSAGGAPTPTLPPALEPTPTPISVVVANPGDAAALVIATNPMFAGAAELKPGLIGASKHWISEPHAGGGYRIELTIGWGDCPAGCIERHVWTFDVDATGGVSLVSETGDPVPSELPA